MNKKLVVLQEDIKDCAPACISSIIKYYGGNMDLESIRKLVNTTKLGTNAYDIVNGVKEIGFDSYAKRDSLDNVIKNFTSPVIIHIKKNNYYHFVVIYKVDKDKITVMDPAVGIRKVKKDFLNSVYQGVYIKLVKVKELPLIKNENHLLKILIKSILKNKKTIIFMFILSIFVFITSLISSYTYKVLIDETSKVKQYAIIFITIITLKYILDFIRNVIFIKLNKKISISLNNEVLRRVFNLPYSYYKNRTTGEILSRFNDLESLKEIILDILVNNILYILMMIGSIIIISCINTKVLAFTMLIIILYTLLSLIIYKLNDKKIKIVQEEKCAYNTLLIESIDGLETINNINLIDNFKNKLNTYYKHLEISKNKLNIYNTVVSIILNYILEVGNIIIVYLSILEHNKNNITLGGLMLLYVLYNYIVTILKNIINMIPDIKYGLRNIQKLNSFLKYKDDSNSNYILNGDIKANNLSYGIYYKIINNLSFEIKEKDKVILLGETASGKSTLLKILLKYFDKYEGNIKIGSKDLKDIDYKSIRNQVTYIGQNEKLFNDTIINNIKQNRIVDEKLLNDILNITKTKDIINSKGLKENTYIEENGFNLSGGERQRIILTRALLDAKKYIFIDEALSEVDYLLEKEIVNNILNYFKDNTIIYVSHKKEIKELFKKNINLERRRHGFNK